MLALLLLLFGVLILPGDGNEGSRAGSCHCKKLISSKSPPTAQELEFFRKQLRTYDDCVYYIRFQMRSRTVCGGAKDPWVLELMRCFNEKECGQAHSGSMTQKQYVPPQSSQVSVSTQRAPLNISTPVQVTSHQPPTTRQSTQPSTSFDRMLTHATGFTSTKSYDLDASADHQMNQKQKKVDSAAGPSVLVPVLSLLAIVFFLFIVLLCLLYKRRQESRQRFADLQPDDAPVTQDLL